MSTELTPKDDHAGVLVAPEQPTVAEMRENVLLSFRGTLRQASGIKDNKEFEMVFGSLIQRFRMQLDHLILLAAERRELH